MILSDSEKADIEKWRSALREDIRLQLFIQDDDAGRRLHAFCIELAGIVPEIILARITGRDADLSEIIISPNISYSAVPLQNELAPFLDTLSMKASSTIHASERFRAALSHIKIPAILKIYVTPQCPFCPQVVTRCLAIARLNRFIQVRVIDCSLYQEQAAQDKIRSVPTVILDDSLRWTGSVDTEELIRMISTRDTMLLGKESIKNIIHDGRAEEVAKMMAGRGQVFPAFVELLTDNNWTVRLGAMAAFEYLVEKSPELCHEINIQLCELFSGLEDRIQGDIAYLLGESRDSTVVTFLEKIIRGAFAPEVIEAASDALTNFI